MPQYHFTVQAGEGDAAERAVELSDDAAALAYACEIIRELKQSLAHENVLELMSSAGNLQASTEDSERSVLTEDRAGSRR
jgi:hypothetical protein